MSHFKFSYSSILLKNFSTYKKANFSLKKKEFRNKMSTFDKYLLSNSFYFNGHMQTYIIICQCIVFNKWY